MGAANDLTEQALRELAELRAEDRSVLSIYLDLDPERFATAPARASAIGSLLDAAHREVEGEERPQAERQALRAALDQARATLQGDQAWSHGARSIALFVCEPLGFRLLLRLPQPLESAVVIAEAPFIAPLTQTGPAGRVCVALVDERFARVLRPSGERLREVISFGDSVHGRHSQGGWSQARYQRSIVEDVEAHLRHVGKVLMDLLRIAPYRMLLIACTEPLWSRVLAALHPDVRALVREERLRLDVSGTGVEDVVQAATAVLASEREEHLRELLERLRARSGRDGDGRVAAGLPDVLQALVERRVDALLHEQGLEVAGVLCPHCGWMDADGERCPADGETVERRANIVEDAIEAAVRQSAEVMALSADYPELGPLGRIAATLRF